MRTPWPGFMRDLFLNSLCASFLVPRRMRPKLLRFFGLKIEKEVSISPKVWFGNRNISIGSGTFINYGCFFNTQGRILIGDNCNLGMQVMIVTNTHEIGPPERRAGQNISVGVEIGNGVWVGARSTILPGVKIGDGAVIAAGSVVTKDLEGNCLYAGVPARRIRDFRKC